MFCHVRGYEEFGIGKVERVSKLDCVVSFFSSPASDSYKLTVDKKNVKIVPLGLQTRVYWKNEDTDSWMVGRVLDGEGENIFVQFPNQNLKKIPAKDIYVRWNKPISDPTPYLANFINETPLFSTSRSSFYRSMMKQRNVSNGMSGLLSSSIELEEHQVEIIRRVLSDSVQRYLLADEVGLGKTIEAGVLIRQHILDHPHECLVIVLVPTTLGQQWVFELDKRFHLNSYIGKELNIISYDIDDSEALLELKDALSFCTMLVIDEVHHLVEGVSANNETPLYKVVRETCSEIENLLLLSATPVLGNEHGFLAMLHLLDPAIYALNSIVDFKKKISKRQELAQIVAQLMPENVYFLEDSLGQLNKIFPDDKILYKLSKELRNVLGNIPDSEDENLNTSIGNLRAHISETYKLHRRILRNRRNRVQGLTPKRIGLENLEYDAPDYKIIVERLDDWRNEAFTSFYNNKDDLRRHHYEKIFWNFIDALICEPGLLIDRINSHLDKIHDEPPFFANEANFLERIVSVCELIGKDSSKKKCLFKKITNLTKSKVKTVIFCTEPRTADDLFFDISRKFGRVVVRHSNLDSNWKSFLIEDTCKILVCDISSEEGLNLQGGEKCIIHFDIPLSPNRIEQRLGRVDRYGSGRDIKSFTLTARHNEYEKTWVKCLNIGFRVFDRSIASLQYLIDEELRDLKPKLFSEGAKCFDEFAFKLVGSKEVPGLLEEELRRISIQDSLDEMYQTCDEMLYDLEDVDEDWKQIELGTDSWVERCLMFQKVPYHVSRPYPPDKVFRYQYSYDRKRNTLFPIVDFLTNFLTTIDKNAPGSTAKFPKTYPYSFRRQTSVSKGVRLLRYGSDFIQGIHDFTQKDDRGKSFALWRCVPHCNNKTIADVYFRFDFVIEIDLEPVLKVCKSVPKHLMKISFNSIQRQGDMLFNPFIKTIWVDSDKQKPDASHVNEYLEIGYSKRPRKNGIYDINLRPERWEIVMTLGVSEIDYWNPLCFDVRKASEKHLRKDVDLSSLIKKAISKARNEDMFHFVQMEARIAHLSDREASIEKERINVEKNIREALYQGTLKPKITLDSIGVVFLSHLSLFDQ
jgi:ATP-dependent helicase HepA